MILNHVFPSSGLGQVILFKKGSRVSWSENLVTKDKILVIFATVLVKILNHVWFRPGDFI